MRLTPLPSFEAFAIEDGFFFFTHGLRITGEVLILRLNFWQIEVLLISFLLNFQLNAKEVTTDRIPEVTIQYAATYDDVCSKKYSYVIDSKWKHELIGRLPGWRNLWNKDGSLLLKTSRQITRKPFREQNFTVALSVCSFPSISMPLIVNSR